MNDKYVKSGQDHAENNWKIGDICYVVMNKTRGYVYPFRIKSITEKGYFFVISETNNSRHMMTHTCPIDYLPTEMFMSTRQNASIKRKPRKAKSKKLFKPDIDRSTEIWLGKLERKLDYEVWFCGHYHIDKQIDKIQMMCHDIRPLHM